MVCGGLKASATDYIAGSIKMIEPAGMKTECHCEVEPKQSRFPERLPRTLRVLAPFGTRNDIKNHSI